MRRWCRKTVLRIRPRPASSSASRPSSTSPSAVSGAYYGDARLDAILESYRRDLGDTVFLFPVGALRAAAALLEISRGQLLLLCGDKGVSREEDLRGRGEPAMVRHRGCFSFSVNLHAIGRYFEEAGGFALHTDQPRPRIQVSAFLCGYDPAALAETRQAFHDATGGFGPGDFHTLAVAMCEQKPPQPLDVMLSVLKLAAFDAEVLYSYREALVAAARGARPAQQEELRRALARVWEGFYSLHKDVPFELARISFAMSQAEDALRYCQESLRLFGESAQTLVMQGYGCAMLGRAAEAEAPPRARWSWIPASRRPRSCWSGCAARLHVPALEPRQPAAARSRPRRRAVSSNAGHGQILAHVLRALVPVSGIMPTCSAKRNTTCGRVPSGAPAIPATPGVAARARWR